MANGSPEAKQDPVKIIKARYGDYKGEKPPATKYTGTDRSIISEVLSNEWDRATEVLKAVIKLPKLEDNAPSQGPADENIHPERGYQFRDNSRRRKMR